MGDALAVSLIRHGLTRYNEESRYLGSTDLPLSAQGRQQLTALAALPLGESDLLVTSDLLRCQETAQLLYPGRRFRTFSALRELDFGLWEGKTYEQLKEDRLYRRWLDDPTGVSPPEGEGLRDFQRRTKQAFGELLSLAEDEGADKVVVITHGGVIRQWLTEYAPLKRNFFEWHVPIGCRLTLSGKKSDVRRGLRFISLLEEPFTERINGR
ncbi:histidine phosphatase family protein [Halalkalibacter oceani]|uniref:Histidine phosphatase family protein n=1 Tax=Halalkalibacter oceani TaxID=1653776 RepID=A0A9X2IN29_9BACI|nr:histidine phosphatase family protein [Halalkalibacter oceani]MCM3713660.1 histidine phosphatase family protein [Halalkalibacter oceani]